MSLAQNPPFVRDFEFLNPVYVYGDRKLVCLRFSSILWKGAPSTKEKCICGSVNCTSCDQRPWLYGLYHFQIEQHPSRKNSTVQLILGVTLPIIYIYSCLLYICIIGLTVLILICILCCLVLIFFVSILWIVVQNLLEYLPVCWQQTAAGWLLGWTCDQPNRTPPLGR